jgi:hypothetical protein
MPKLEMGRLHIPTFVKDWWPVMTVIIVVSGVFSSSISYYARAETKEMIKAELLIPIGEFNKKTEDLNKQLNEMSKEQIKNQTKIDLLLDLMQKNNNLLNSQSRDLEQLKK